MPLKFIRQRQHGPSVGFVWCPKCGTRNQRKDKFCRLCATKLEIELQVSDNRSDSQRPRRKAEKSHK